MKRLEPYHLLLKRLLPYQLGRDSSFVLQADGKEIGRSFVSLIEEKILAQLLTSQSIELLAPMPKQQKQQKKAILQELSPQVQLSVKIEDGDKLSRLVLAFWSLITTRISLAPAIKSLRLSRAKGRKDLFDLSLTLLPDVVIAGGEPDWLKIMNLLLKYSGIERPAEERGEEECKLKFWIFYPQTLNGKWIFCTGSMNEEERSVSYEQQFQLEHPKQLPSEIPPMAALIKPGRIVRLIYRNQAELLSFKFDGNLPKLWQEVAEIILSPLCPLQLISLSIKCDLERKHCLLWLAFSPMALAQQEEFAKLFWGRFNVNREMDEYEFSQNHTVLMPLYPVYRQDKELVSLGSYTLTGIRSLAASSKAPLLINAGGLPSPVKTFFTVQLPPVLDATLLQENLITSNTAIRLNPGSDSIELLIFDRKALTKLGRTNPTACSQSWPVKPLEVPWFFFKLNGDSNKLGYVLQGFDLDLLPNSMDSDEGAWLMAHKLAPVDNNFVQFMVMQSTVPLKELMALARRHPEKICSLRAWKTGGLWNFSLLGFAEHEAALMAIIPGKVIVIPSIDSSLQIGLPTRPDHPAAVVETENRTGIEWKLHLNPQETASFENAISVLEDLPADFFTRKSHPKMLQITPASKFSPTYVVNCRVKNPVGFYAHLIKQLPFLPAQSICLYPSSLQDGIEATISIAGNLHDAFLLTDLWEDYTDRLSVHPILNLNLDSDELKVDGKFASSSGESESEDTSRQQLVRVVARQSIGHFSEDALLARGLSLLQNLKSPKQFKITLLDRLPLGDEGDKLLNLAVKLDLTSKDGWVSPLVALLRNQIELKKTWSLAGVYFHADRLSEALMQIDYIMIESERPLLILRLDGEKLSESGESCGHGLDQTIGFSQEYQAPVKKLLEFVRYWLLMIQLPLYRKSVDGWTLQFIGGSNMKQRGQLRGKGWRELVSLSKEAKLLSEAKEWQLQKSPSRVGEGDQIFELALEAANLPGLTPVQGALRILGYSHRLLLGPIDALNKVDIKLGGCGYKLTFTFANSNPMTTKSIFHGYLVAFLHWLDQAPPSLATLPPLCNHLLTWSFNGLLLAGPTELSGMGKRNSLIAELMEDPGLDNSSDFNQIIGLFADMFLNDGDNRKEPEEEFVAPAYVQLNNLESLSANSSSVPPSPPTDSAPPSPMLVEPSAPPLEEKLARTWNLSGDEGHPDLIINTMTDFEQAWPKLLSENIRLSLPSRYQSVSDKDKRFELEFLGDEPPYEAALALMRHVLETKEIYHRSILAVSLESGDYQEGGSADDHVFDDEAFFEYYKFHREEDVEDREEENDTGYTEEELVEMTRWLTLCQENRAKQERRRKRRLRKEQNHEPEESEEPEEPEPMEELQIQEESEQRQQIEDLLQDIKPIPCWADDFLEEPVIHPPPIPISQSTPTPAPVEPSRWILVIETRGDLNDTKRNRLLDHLQTIVPGPWHSI